MTIYAKTETWLTAPAGGELLMMHRESGAFQGLNATGFFLWEALDEPQRRDQLLAALLLEFDVSAEQAAADIDGFLDALLESKAIHEHATT